MPMISIFGCGWVGKALAQSMEQTHLVKASVQSQKSFDALTISHKFLLNKNNDFFDLNFFQTNILVIAIPPREEYLQTLKKVLSYTNDKTQIILCSSTSVYTQQTGEVYEEDTHAIKNPSVMLEAEKLVQELKPQSLILRIGGLMGYDRIAGKYTAGKTLKEDAYVNYIHKDDVVALMKRCIETKVDTKIYNLVAPIHASKKEIYETNAQAFGFEKTIFEDTRISGKKVSSYKLRKELDYTFIFENPLEFWS